MNTERRRTPRFPFVAVAEITEKESGTELSYAGERLEPVWLLHRSQKSFS